MTEEYASSKSVSRITLFLLFVTFLISAIIAFFSVNLFEWNSDFVWDMIYQVSATMLIFNFVFCFILIFTSKILHIIALNSESVSSQPNKSEK